MTAERISAHPILEPLDYELTPEAASKLIGPEQLHIYELMWNAGIATAMDGPALRQEILEISITQPTSDQPPAQELILLAAQTQCIEKGWGVLLPSEIPCAFSNYVSLDDSFPEIITNSLGSATKAFLDQNGCRVRSAEQCISITSLLNNSQEWAADVVEISPRGLTIDLLIETMADHGVGRPSTYADRLFTAIKNDLIIDTSDRLQVGEYGQQVLDLLAKLEPSAIIDATFNAELECALCAIESDPSTAGSVLRNFCKRSLDESTELVNWLDELVIDGESFGKSIARSEASLPPANSWDFFALPEGLSPERLAKLPEKAIAMRNELDLTLAAADKQRWKKFSARQRAAIRLAAFMTSNCKEITLDISNMAARDLVLRWWIDLGPHESPISGEEVDTANLIISGLNVETTSSVRTLAALIQGSL
jgi:hypothetical protein